MSKKRSSVRKRGQKEREKKGDTGVVNHIGNGEKTKARVDESFLMEGGAGIGEERLFSWVPGRACVTNGLKVPPPSPVSRRCHWPPQWACGQAVTLSR